MLVSLTEEELKMAICGLRYARSCVKEDFGHDSEDVQELVDKLEERLGWK